MLTTTIDEKATGELTLGGGYSTDAGALLDIGLSERNLIGSGISAGINGVLAQRRSSITASITDPYFLDRNLVVGGDVFLIQTNYPGHRAVRREARRLRRARRLRLQRISAPGLELLAGRTHRVQRRAGCELLHHAACRLHACCPRSARRSPSTIATARSIRTPAILPRSALILPAWAAMRNSSATNVNGQYFIPLDRFTGNSDWGIALTAGIGYLFNVGPAGADHRPLLPGWRQPARLPDRRRRPARCRHRRPAGRAVHLDPVDRAALPAADFGRYRPVRARLRRCRRPDPGQFREPATLSSSRTGALRDRRLRRAACRRRRRHLLAHSVRSVKR